MDTTQHKTQTRNARSKMNKAENEAYATLIFKAIKYVILRDDSYGSINLVLTYAKKYLIIYLKQVSKLASKIVFGGSQRENVRVLSVLHSTVTFYIMLKMHHSMLNVL